jgi:hypothetical protein
MNAALQAKPPVMWRRMALIIGCAVFIGLAAAIWIRVHAVATERYTLVSERLSGSAQSFARELHGRLESADALVRYLSATDAGANGTLLQDRVLTADAFHGVVVVPYRENAADAVHASDPAALLISISGGDRRRHRSVPAASGQLRQHATAGAVPDRSRVALAGRRGIAESAIHDGNRPGRSPVVSG